MTSRKALRVGVLAWVMSCGAFMVTAAAQKPARGVDPPLKPGEPGGTRGGASAAGGGGRAGGKTVPADAVSVTVKYTGKGAVDAEHEIVLLLLSSASLDAANVRATQVMAKSGATAVFRGISGAPVYLAAVYDESGAYHGGDGTVPAGLPMGFFAHDAKSPPQSVKPGQAAVTLTFSDEKKSGS